jgi:hypothetical protein
VYVRFITSFVNEAGEIETGIFNALAFIRDHSLTIDDDVNKLTVLMKWFNRYLAKPDRFSNSGNKNPAAIALSWFKDTAKTDIQKIFDLKEILLKYEIVIEMVTSKKPGYIVYEDKHQVSAIPFKSDRKQVQ